MNLEIRAIRRDAHGNFRYQQPDGAEATVFAQSPTATAFEQMWAAGREIYDEAVARRSKRPPSLGSRLRNRLARATSGLVGLWRRVTRRPPDPALGVRTIGQLSENRVGGPIRVVSQDKAQVGADPILQPSPSRAPESPTQAAQPVKETPGVEEPAPPSKDLFSIALFRRIDSGDFRLVFHDGIQVDVPAGSSQGRKFGEFLAATEKISRSVDAAAPGALDHQAPAAPQPTKEMRGNIVPLGRGSAGKDRFAFDNEGVLYPLPLSDQETMAVKKLLRSGKLQSVSVQTEPTTQVLLRTVQVKEGSEIVEKPFAEFLKPAPRSKRDRVAKKEAAPAGPFPPPKAPVQPPGPSAAGAQTPAPIWSPVSPSQMGLTHRAVETLAQVLNAGDVAKDLFGELFSAEENSISGAKVTLAGPTALRVSFAYSYLDYHEAGEDHLQPTAAEKTFDHTFALSAEGNWKAEIPHQDMDIPKRTICVSLERLIAQTFGPAPHLENPPGIAADPVSPNPAAGPVPPERQAERPPATAADVDRASNALARVAIPTLEELEGPAPEHT